MFFAVIFSNSGLTAVAMLGTGEYTQYTLIIISESFVLKVFT